MRQIEWVNPNKMKIETGHKTFDRQCSYIGTGNQIGDAVVSFYIRPFNITTNPAGQPCAPGDMQRFDLGMFPSMPADVRRCIEREAVDRHVIAYEFFHHNGGDKISHGWIVTDANHNLLQMFPARAPKSADILAVCRQFVAN